MGEYTLIERQGARGELVLNRPEKRNAIIGPLVEELIAGLAELSADDSIHSILIRGAGGTFCAGLDLDAFSADPPPPWRAEQPRLWATFHAALYECPKPTVAALERAAIAAGSALALACDFLVVGETARLAVPEVKMGISAPVNIVWLVAKWGPALALEMAVSGRTYSGRELMEKGIVHRCVADDQVLTEARALADSLAENNPLAVAAIKRTIRTLVGGDDFRARLQTAQQVGRIDRPTSGFRERREQLRRGQ